MLQVASLPEGATVREVVGLVHALHGTGPTVNQLLDLAGLSGLARREVSTLSGGQAQRVRFAAALAGRPRLLVLDEPTTGMDVESRTVFWDAVRRIGHGRTAVLVATHYPQEADRCADRVVMIAAGQVVVQGTPGQLKADRAHPVVTVVTDHPDTITALPLPGRTRIETHGSQLRIHTSDPDGTLRVLRDSGLSLHVADLASGDLSDVLLSVTTARTEP
jgi:ABC-2 type transport system ATP-binding protein